MLCSNPEHYPLSAGIQFLGLYAIEEAVEINIFVSGALGYSLSAHRAVGLTIGVFILR